MPQMSPSQVRVVDPVLTQVARGYRNAALVGMALFPYVPVAVRGGKIITFGKEIFRLHATARAPGANLARLPPNYGSQSFALEQNALAGDVPFEHLEDAAVVPGIDLGAAAVYRVQSIVGLGLEKAQADLARNAAAYAASNKITLSGTSQWSDPASNPIAAIETGKDAVRSQTGIKPNTLLLSAAAFKSLKTHASIVDRIKYTSREVATPELLASLLGLDRVVVGEAVYQLADGTIADVWGKDAVLAYTAISPLPDASEPSYGYTYRLTDYPIVEEPYIDRATRSWVYPVIDETDPVIAGADAGYLFVNAVA